MAKTIIIAGFGTGISKAVAEKFGKEGFQLALVARNADRLGQAVKEFEGRGIRAAAFPTDLADPEGVRRLAGSVRDKLGPVNVLHWNAYSMPAGDLLAADAAALRSLFDIPIASLVLTVQAVLPDLRAQKDGAILITNGGLGVLDANMEAMAVNYNAMGLALANAAKHKLSRVLAQKLGPEGIYVGEVMVLGTVKGTSWDNGSATVEASAIADRFWQIYGARKDANVTIS
jgi:NADP-dependent 3-hydroxy acid dehydrogenase YdfG